MGAAPWWVPIIVALISAGLFAWFKQIVTVAWKNRRRATPAGRAHAARMEDLALTDQSLVVVARARDELESDNARVRAERDEDARRHATERAAWDAERAQMRRDQADERAEWARERQRMRDHIDDLEARMRAMLEELMTVRAGITDPMPGDGPSLG